MKDIVSKERGFSLIELALIIVIIGIIGTIALRSLQPSVDQAREEATMQEMKRLEYAITGNPNLVSDGVRADFGYLGDIGSLPSSLDGLVTNPGGFTTWKGPYIQNDFVEDPEDFKKDAWGDYYSYSGGVFLISNGGGNPLTLSLAAAPSELTSNSIVGAVYDGLGSSPGDSAANVTVTVYYPDGSGSMTSASLSPVSDGTFQFNDMIPIGNHLVRAIFQSSNDTTGAIISVPKSSSVYCELRFSSALW